MRLQLVHLLDYLLEWANASRVLLKGKLFQDYYYKVSNIVRGFYGLKFKTKIQAITLTCNRFMMIDKGTLIQSPKTFDKDWDAGAKGFGLMISQTILMLNYKMEKLMKLSENTIKLLINYMSINNGICIRASKEGNGMKSSKEYF